MGGRVHDGGMRDDEDDVGLVDDEGRPVRRCIQCHEPVTFDSQPGHAACEACGVRQYLTRPWGPHPTGFIMRAGGGPICGHCGKEASSPTARFCTNCAAPFSRVEQGPERWHDHVGPDGRITSAGTSLNAEDLLDG